MFGSIAEAVRRGPINLDAAPPRAAVRAALGLRRRLQSAADKLVPPEILAYENAISFFRLRVAAALIEVGAIDAIGEDTRGAAELAGELGLNADMLERTLRLAAVHGLVRPDGDGFSLTPAGAALRADASPSMAPWTLTLATPATQHAWAGLPAAIRTGEPPFPVTNGSSVWEHFAVNPEEERLFAKAMRNLSRLTLPWIVDGYPWPERGTLADIAGGSGPVLAAVLAARPGMQGILVEAPGVLGEAEEHLRDAGVRDRVELATGDIFEQVDAEADLYVLKDILHDWDDKRSIRILSTVAAAMPPGSKLILVEQLLEPDEIDPISVAVDLHMLTQCDGGRQRSVAELQDLIVEAGLRPGEVHRTGGPALVEALA